MKKVGVIGIGKMGISHLAIANRTRNMEVAAMCDSSRVMVMVLEKHLGIRGYVDYRKMIERESLDGVIICVPNAFHYEIAKQCIKSGLSVFVEKPFTLSYEHSNELLLLAEQHNVRGQVGYVNRYNLMFMKIRKLLRDKVIGDIVWYLNRMSGSVITKPSSKGWRNDYKKGGGCLFDYGPHCFDLSTYFFGEDVEVLSARLTKIYSTEVDDVVSASLLHDSRILGINYVNWCDASKRKASNSIEIEGERGKILANKQEAKIFLKEENQDLNLRKGWNEIYNTSESTSVNYYLRGEEFSLQMADFSDLLNDQIDDVRSSLKSASVTDKLLQEIFLRSGGVH